ncbi:MAG: hypothetical protein IPK87_02380 [Planctomycetes bacterium]|nr:hypothetical protein [Planctomycetota bacterium]
MKTIACTLFAALALLLLGATAGASQRVKSPSVEPLQDADEAVLTLPKEDTVPLSDLIQLYVERRGIAIIFNPRSVRGDVKLKAEEQGKELRGTEFDMFVSNALEQFRFVLVRTITCWTIVPSVEAATATSVLTEGELATADGWSWACVHVALEQAEVNALTGQLRDKVSTYGGLVQPSHPNTLILVERVDRLKLLLPEVRALDKAPAYERYQTRDAAAAVKALREQFKGKPATFTVDPAGHVVARADTELQGKIADAIAALD